MRKKEKGKKKRRKGKQNNSKEHWILTLFIHVCEKKKKENGIEKRRGKQLLQETPNPYFVFKNEKREKENGKEKKRKTK